MSLVGAFGVGVPSTAHLHPVWECGDVLGTHLALPANPPAGARGIHPPALGHSTHRDLWLHGFRYTVMELQQCGMDLHSMGWSKACCPPLLAVHLCSSHPRGAKGAVGSAGRHIICALVQIQHCWEWLCTASSCWSSCYCVLTALNSIKAAGIHLLLLQRNCLCCPDTHRELQSPSPARDPRSCCWSWQWEGMSRLN